ncbi:MAG: ribonuclease D [archaeon]|nr:ribonuclease D [archaeon]
MELPLRADQDESDHDRFAELYFSSPGVARPYVWVNRDEVLEDAWRRHWRHAGLLALDTEFLHVDTYHPVPALVQISSGEHTWLIDASTRSTHISSWLPLLAVLQNGHCLKVIHGCRADILLFFAMFGDAAAGLQAFFDTQLAAMSPPCLSVLSANASACGDELQPTATLGYARLVQYLLPHIHQEKPVSKAQQCSDWTIRPLTADQLAYAARDVSHLIEIYHALCALLPAEELQLWRHGQRYGQHPRVAAFVHEIREPDLERAFLKKLCVQRRGPAAVAAAAATAAAGQEDPIHKAWRVWHDRELIARYRNLPKQWILKDDELLDHVYIGKPLRHIFFHPPFPLPVVPPLSPHAMKSCLRQPKQTQKRRIR